LLDLNPVFKTGFVPEMGEPTTLYLPRTLVADFIDREDFVRHSYVADLSTPAPASTIAQRVDSPVAGEAKRTHVVRRGESLGSIAKKNRVSVGELRAWNRLRSDRLKAGHRLVVKPSPRTTSDNGADAAPQDNASTNEQHVEYIYHIVQPGDTLWGIAQNYPGTTVDAIRRLNSGMNLKKLPVGKKLKVGVQKS
jgi:membrane-bound lytic murein transglycosylase D